MQATTCSFCGQALGRSAGLLLLAAPSSRLTAADQGFRIRCAVISQSSQTNLLMPLPSLLIAGTHSGCGKTILDAAISEWDRFDLIDGVLPP
ncbi:hypothetical protein VU06_01080 [Desulfobulbus sp. F3]|nr:hypothetical protein [Desulfobulbus sp. F3]